MCWVSAAVQACEGWDTGSGQETAGLIIRRDVIIFPRRLEPAKSQSNHSLRFISTFPSRLPARRQRERGRDRESEKGKVEDSAKLRVLSRGSSQFHLRSKLSARRGLGHGFRNAVPKALVLL